MEWTHAPNWIASLGGIRAWKGDAQSNHTYYIYDGGTPLLELDGQGNVSAVNTFGPTGLLSRHSATGSTFYTFDAQGSVAQRLNSSGNVLSSSAFDAHGNKVIGDGATDPWGYNAQSGYYTDAETGLILCTHRYYDPSQGRWLNRDPIGYAGGINLYGYVGNGVVGGVDPSGYFPWAKCKAYAKILLDVIVEQLGPTSPPETEIIVEEQGAEVVACEPGAGGPPKPPFPLGRSDWPKTPIEGAEAAEIGEVTEAVEAIEATSGVAEEVVIGVACIL